MGQGNIIGYEINEKTCQISFYNEQQLEPETLEEMCIRDRLTAERTVWDHDQKTGGKDNESITDP